MCKATKGAARELRLGDKMIYNSGSLKGIKVVVTAVNRSIYTVQRLDHKKNAWFRYAKKEDMDFSE